MRLTILTVGSRGDVQPYVALGKGLQAAGHDINFATHTNFQDFVLGQGLQFSPLPGNTQELFAQEEGTNHMETDHNTVQFVRQSVENVIKPIFDELLPASWEACQGTDAIISMPLAVGSYHIAERLGVPFYGVWTCPVTRTRSFPSPFAPASLRKSGLYNWTSYVLVEQLFWQSIRKKINRWRRDTLALAPIPLTDYNRPYREKLPTLYGISPTVVPRPSDWPDCVHIPGYWFLDPNPNWTPAPDLADFLESGPPPVYISFGSLIDRDPEALTSLILEAIAQTGQRAIIDVGWGGLGKAKAPENVFIAESSDAPHAWLFPRVSAVVHHGGAGTTAAALRAGVPSVTIPSFGELYFWGQRIADLGAGVAPIPKRQLSVKVLAEAIEAVTSDRSICESAASIGEKIRAEDGVARAVEVLHSYFAPQKVAI